MEVLVKQTIIITVFFLFLAISAFGKVTEFDKGFKANPERNIQDAVILEEIGVIDHAFTSQLSKNKYNVKMKFFTKKAIEEHGTIKLSFTPPRENISGIKGTVYLPDGTTVTLSKNDIHKKKTSKEWGTKGIEISIVFPALTEGAIVEYSYYHSYNGLQSINTWPFQSDLYTVKPKVTFIAWPMNKFGMAIANQLNTPNFKKGRKGNIPYYELTRTNIPPIKKEKFSLPLAAQREAVVFYYFDTDIKYKNYWIERGEDLYKHSLKKRLKSCRSSNSIITKNHLIEKTQDETIKNIFDFTVNNYTSLTTLSKKQLAEIDEKYIDKLQKANTVTKMLKLKYLFKSQMNYILASLIKSGIPNATVEYGYYIPFNKNLFNPNVKTYRQFTDELLKVTVNNKVYWLSPIKRLLQPNELPYGAHGIKILVVGENGTYFEKIPTDTFDKVITTTTKDIFINEDSITIKEKIVYNKYKSYSKRRLMAYFKDNEIRDLFEEDMFDNHGEDAELLSFKVDNLKDIYKPLIITKEIKYPYELDDSSNSIFLKLIGINKYTKNPFNTKLRKQNIIFSYPNKTIENITYHLPEDFKLSSVPKNQIINPNNFMYKMTFTKKEDNLLSLTIEDTLERNYFSKAAASYFKNTYNKIIKANDTKIVIEEID